MRTDCHTHTSVSPDSEAPIEAMLSAARAKGITHYAVTDHIELCRWYPRETYGAAAKDDIKAYDFKTSFEKSLAQNEAAREKAEGIIIASGIELGEPETDFALSEALYRDPRLDLVLASVHELPEEGDFYFMDYTRVDARVLMEKYFSRLWEIARHDCFDVMAHLTYPLRYIIGREHLAVKPEDYLEMAAEIYRELIRNKKGLELNTAYYLRPYGQPSPEEPLLRLYRELGGELLTIGSDAHRPEDVGSGLEEGLALARACGFTQVCWYEHHEPQMVKI